MAFENMTDKEFKIETRQQRDCLSETVAKVYEEFNSILAAAPEDRKPVYQFVYAVSTTSKGKDSDELARRVCPHNELADANARFRGVLKNIMEVRWAYEEKNPAALATVLRSAGLRDRPYAEIDYQAFQEHLENLEKGKKVNTESMRKLFSGVIRSEEDMWGLVVATIKQEGGDYLHKKLLDNGGPHLKVPTLNKIVSRLVKKDGSMASGAPHRFYLMMKMAMEGTVYVTMRYSDFDLR